MQKSAIWPCVEQVSATARFVKALSAMALTYSVTDRSVLLPHYKRFFVEPTLAAIPARLSPNLITHAGHLLCLAALALCVVAGRSDGREPAFFGVALLLNAYLWCDNADGSHARRTNQCSATGEFLDHGLDLLNATYVAVMTIITLGAPPYWSVAAAVIVPAAAAVTYWEQAETGVFQLGMFNQIESIACLTVMLCVRGMLGANVMRLAHIGPLALPTALLAFTTLVAGVGILHSFVRVARHHGRLIPFVAPLAFGVALALAVKTGALGTLPAIVAGAAVYIFLGIRQLTLRGRGQLPLTEHGALVAAAVLGALSTGPTQARTLEWPVTIALAAAFGIVALIRAVQGHEQVRTVDAARGSVATPGALDSPP